MISNSIYDQKHFGMNVPHNIMLLLCCILLGTSCNDEISGNMKAKSTALGKMNQIVVISDQDVWEGAIGDSVEYYFESSYPILPTPESFFDLRHFTTTELENEKLRRELRTYLVVADLSDTDSETTQMIRKDLGETKYLAALEKDGPTNSVGIDKWARNQLVIYLYGNGEEALAEAIQRSFSAIAKRIHLHDKKQLEAQVYGRAENFGLTRKLEENMGIQMRVPGEYVVALEKPEENMIWLRKDDSKSVLNLVIKKLEYNNKDQISKSAIKTLRDAFGKEYVSTDVAGSFMQTNDVDLPMYEYTIDINGMYTLETRGIWEINNDFLGGPFASYLILAPNQKDLYFIDSFVYAPGKNKRDLMQQLELMVKSITVGG